MSSFNPVIIVTLLFFLLGCIFLVATVFCVGRRRFVAAAMNFILLLLMFSLSALSGTIGIATRGYRAFTKEEVAAIVKIDPLGERKFRARFSMPDGSDKIFFLSGDQLYVDAHILKWKPLANLIGLHTSYELDRVAGRYVRIEDERKKPHTAHSLSKNRILNLYDLRQRFDALNPLLDAQYGSATYIDINGTAELKVMVSTTGLLIRKSEKKPSRSP